MDSSPDDDNTKEKKKRQSNPLDPLLAKLTKKDLGLFKFGYEEKEERDGTRNMVEVAISVTVPTRGESLGVPLATCDISSINTTDAVAVKVVKSNSLSSILGCR